MDNVVSDQRPTNWDSRGQCIRSIISITSKMFQAETGGVMLFDVNHNQLVLQKPAFNVNDYFVEKYKVPITIKSNAGRVFNTGEPYFSNNASSDEFILREYADLYNCRNVITVPLTHQQTRLGVLHLLNKQVGEWKQQDLNSLTTLLEDFSPFFGHLIDPEDSVGKSGLIQRLLNIAATSGLHGLTSELASIISGSVVVLDHSLNVLSVSPDTSDISELVQEVKYKFHSKTIYPQNEVLKLKSNLIMPIIGDNLILGYIIIPAKDDLSNHLFLNKEVANIFALSLQEKTGSLKAFAKFGKQVFERLFDPETPNQQAIDICNFLGIHLGEPYIVMVFNSKDQRPDFENYFNRVKNQFQGFLGNKDNLFFALVPLVNNDLNFTVQKVLQSLSTINPTPATVGLSEKCYIPGDFHRSFLQAKRACEIGTKLGQNISYFNSLQFYDTLYDTAKNINAESFASKLLEPILHYDRRNSADLLITLEHYLENDGNLRETANSLYVHLNTLRYRLGKIEKLTGSSLRNFRNKYQLRFALDILKFSEPKN